MKTPPRYLVRTPFRVLLETDSRDNALGALGNAIIDGHSEACVFDRELDEVIA